MAIEFPPIAALKAQARDWRAQCGAQTVTHAQALEHIAARYGVRDWNTLAALAPIGPHWAQSGAPVMGHYLGQRFSGKVLTCGPAKTGVNFAVTIAFDTPVDVVPFTSFSNMRSRVSSVVNAEGRSENVTSDGVPHMQIDPLA